MNPEKMIVCTACPKGCRVSIRKNKADEYILDGASCKKGREFVMAELTDPLRCLTTTVAVSDGQVLRLPVRTAKDIPRHLIFKALKIIHGVSVKAPVSAGDVIVDNICGTGIAVIASQSIS